ncbi:MAG: plasmid maintenance system killer protein [Bacteroidales bacterium]|nr:plasmid maintenance system killer protein [Bacteroidales bacterium]
MLIQYKNRQIQRVCTVASVAEKKHGKMMAERIQQRVDQIEAAETVEWMIQFRIGRCHPLKGDREGQYAVDLIHPYRLIFKIKGKTDQIAVILSIEDYH